MGARRALYYLGWRSDAPRLVRAEPSLVTLSGSTGRGRMSARPARATSETHHAEAVSAEPGHHQLDHAEPDHHRSDEGDALTLERAHHRIAAGALRAGPLGRVGLELEFHLVDRAFPGEGVPWRRLADAVRELPRLPGASAVSVEPGGQIELSTPPCADVAAAVDALRADETALRTALAGRGLGLASLGADPARPSRRVTRAPRYLAMEEHFAAVGTRTQGLAMMCSTAAIQVNLEAGPRSGWAGRVSLAHLLGPVLVAISTCSPMLAGARSGWRSMRQQVWGELDQARCGPILVGVDPAREWARYALCAPVMLVRGPPDRAEPVRAAVPFGAWVAGAARLGRAPTRGDLDYHLGTLFPPVRLRGFIELRCLDAMPARWWPALAAVATVLLDDPVAADVAAAACEPVAGRWTAAARHGLRDPALAAAADRCLDAAVAASPPALKGEVEAYAALIATRRTPGDELADRIARIGPRAALKEEAHA